MDNDFEKNDRLGRLMAQEFISELERIEKTASESTEPVDAPIEGKSPSSVLRELLQQTQSPTA